MPVYFFFEPPNILPFEGTHDIGYKSIVFQPNFIIFLILLNLLVSVNILVIKIITSNLADVWQIIFSLNLLTFYHLKGLVLAIKV